MNRILVPTDFSNNANHATNLALELGERTHAEIILFHSSNPNEGMNNSVYSPIFIHEYYDVKKKSIEQLADQLKSEGYPGIITPVYEIDFTVAAIVQCAEDRDADLIVMGSTGASGLQGMILGSTASGVIARATRPVFIIPREYKLPGAGTDVFIATDYQTPVAAKSKAFLQVLKEHLGYNLTAVHVDQEVAEHPHVTDFLTQNFDNLVTAHLQLEGEYITDKLLELQEEKPKSILCTITRHRNWFERIFSSSVSKSLVNHPELPLICLQEAS